jgi:biopolymer transport protein ExbD
MATLIPQPTSKSKTKLHPLKIDMTPMVDLGFLLITFFIFNTALAAPTITKLSMPRQSNGTMKVDKKKLLTILVDKQKVYVYEGVWEEAVAANQIKRSTFHVETGVGSTIRQKQKQLDVVNERDELMIAIKPHSSASYQDVINALDEMYVNKVKRYGIMQITEEEKHFLSLVQ